MIPRPPSSPLFPYTTRFRSYFFTDVRDYLSLLGDGVDERRLARFHLRDRPLQGRGNSLGRLERSEEHTSELQSRLHLVCRLLLEKKKIARLPATVRTFPTSI